MASISSAAASRVQAAELVLSGSFARSRPLAMGR